MTVPRLINVGEKPLLAKQQQVSYVLRPQRKLCQSFIPSFIHFRVTPVSKSGCSSVPFGALRDFCRVRFRRESTRRGCLDFWGAGRPPKGPRAQPCLLPR